jgi:hypothetical protein
MYLRLRDMSMVLIYFSAKLDRAALLNSPALFSHGCRFVVGPECDLKLALCDSNLAASLV